MKIKALVLPVAAALVLGAAAFGIDAAVDNTRSLMAPAVRDSEARVIEQHMREALGACRDLAADAREICRVRARSEERVATAELDARYYGTVSAAARARAVRTRARFDLARAECVAAGDTGRHACLAAARADQAKALSHVASAT